MSLGQRPRKKLFPKKRALKAQINVPLIPDIAFVEFGAVLAQKIAILFLKTTGAMVVLLTRHVFDNGIELAGAHGECAVTALPIESSVFRIYPFDPFR